MRGYLTMSFEERVALLIALALAALSCVGQGIQFFTGGYDAYDTGMFVVIILSALAGIALAFEADEFPDSLDATRNHEKSLKFARSVEHVLLVCGIEFVLGELLFVVALATNAPGIDGDVTVILAPLLVGVLMGGGSCLVGTLIGFLVAWPLVKLVRFVLGRRDTKPTSPIGPRLALLFLSLVAMAILGTLGSNPPDVIGTINGRGIYDIVYLYTDYSGTPVQQVMAWIARVLGVAIVLEVIWMRRAGLAQTRPATSHPGRRVGT